MISRDDGEPNRCRDPTEAGDDYPVLRRSEAAGPPNWTARNQFDKDQRQQRIAVSGARATAAMAGRQRQVFSGEAEVHVPAAFQFPCSRSVPLRWLAFSFYCPLKVG